MKKAKKILILGSRGMLGSDLCFVFRKEKLICWEKKELDITNKKEVKGKIKKLNPKIVINAAAYTNVEKAEKEFILAKKINAKAVRNLIEVCDEINAVFVHYSTDYVFDGKNKNGYYESSRPIKPINKYGLSKLLGEQELLRRSTRTETRTNADGNADRRESRFYLIRTSWLFGSRTEPNKHKNFVQTILKLAKEKKALKIINDQFGKPTYTFDLSQATKKLIDKKMPRGIYHLSNEGITTWYKFAKEITKIANLRVKILPCKTSEYKTLAKRPKYSILLNTKFTRLRSWKRALKDYLISG